MKILDFKNETMVEVKKKELIKALTAMIRNYAEHKQSDESKNHN